MIEYGSWRTCLHAMGGAFVVQLLLTFFFMPESAFHRTGTLDIDTGAHAVEATDKAAVDQLESTSTSASAHAPAEAPHSFARELLPSRGVAGADHVLIGRQGGIERPFADLRAELSKALAKLSR